MPVHTLEEVAAALKGLKSAVICTHISPDPDAIGSAAGLLLLLAELGVEGTLYLPEAVPERLEGMLQGITPVHSVPEGPFSAAVVVDTASRRRVGADAEAVFRTAATIINIDHHASNPAWGEVNYIDASSASSASIVLSLYEQLGIVPSVHAASLLFAGLCDDTGSFRYSNADKVSFETAARLVGYGASPSKISEQLYYSVPERVIRLESLAAARLRVVLGGRISVISVDSAMLAECGARAEDTEGIVEIARSIKGTIGSVFMREVEDGWKLSLRSKNDQLDVNAIAGQFGGGGHRAAAGCRVVGTLEEVEAQVLKALGEVLDTLPGPGR